jgi:hypothetical protein
LSQPVSIKEQEMFETLMKAGSYRVDYMNRSVGGKERAFAFYVCGYLPENAAYSTNGKHQLFAGLTLIKQTLGYENLVAVYLDVLSTEHKGKPAYNVMKDDIRSGMFRRVFILRAGEMFDRNCVTEDILQFYQEVGGFDLLTFEQGAFKPILLMKANALA